jgi:hypothetical protein
MRSAGTSKILSRLVTGEFNTSPTTSGRALARVTNLWLRQSTLTDAKGGITRIMVQNGRVPHALLGHPLWSHTR